MTAYLTDFRGEEYMLPVPISWEMSHGIGTPCDAFEICFACDGSVRETLSDAVRFRAEYEGETVFVGVVDEVEVCAGGRGMLGTVRGRGLGALLLDNEAEAAEYQGASLEFILGAHVYPWGITQLRAGGIVLPGLFSVAAGSSQWRVLEDFVWLGGGLRPRFSMDGVLILNGEVGRELCVDEECPVTSIGYTDRRYGVMSQALVKNRSWGNSCVVDNAEFLARGGMRRQVITMPRNSGYDALRSTGEYQIRRSAEGAVSLTLALPRPFAAFPADLVSLSSAPLGISGEFSVYQSRCFADGEGAGTILTLHERKG